ncbi:hypothetical protein [Planctomyces sp. SH-PL14]|uniref:hypothetical protein n=1 Tax=Planctomyces sp. SH-PL14 TaxID=1632864 RepID=UPI0018D444E9|nr:hypothetical protein [Planctomyces sp. SH-PL14]
MFWPNATLQTLGQTASREPAYVSFAAVVLLTLGAMYLPAACNPYRHRTIAWLSVLARPPGVSFFFILYSGTYPLFGVVDLVLSLLQIPLLILALYGKVDQPSGLAIEGDDPKAQSPFGYFGTTFRKLQSVVWSDAYSRIPYHLALGPFRLITFCNHSARNLIDKRDLLPYFDKLIHANGICHAGTWEITEESPYSGFFAKGSKGLLLARLSVAGLTVSPGTRRAFGIAGKLFPTMDHDEQVYPANFVTVSHLSGDRSNYVIDIPVTNRPTIGLDPLANLINRGIFRLMDRRPGFRQLHPISMLGLGPKDPVSTPTLMMLRAPDSLPRVKAKDFREELRVKNYPNGELIFEILVRESTDKAWNRIGRITFTDDIVSESGDKRLHFWIPRDIGVT